MSITNDETFKKRPRSPRADRARQGLMPSVEPCEERVLLSFLSWLSNTIDPPVQFAGSTTKPNTQPPGPIPSVPTTTATAAKPTTTTTQFALSPSASTPGTPSTATYGQPVIFTASVAATPYPEAAGALTLVDNPLPGQVLFQGSFLPATGQAASQSFDETSNSESMNLQTSINTFLYTTDSLSAGKYQGIAASYLSGVNDIGSSTSPKLSLTINSATPTVSVTASQSSALSGQTIAVSAVITPPFGLTPTGSAQLIAIDPATGTKIALGQPQTLSPLSPTSPDSTQDVSWKVDFTGFSGKVTFEVDYSPDANDTNWSPSSGQLANYIVKAVATPDLVMPDIFYGQPATFTASLSMMPSSALAPSGSMQFSVDNVPLGKPVRPNAPGVYTSPEDTDLLAVGSNPHQVTATFIPDDPNDYVGLTGTASLIIHPAPLTVAPTVAPSSYGSQAQASAMVSLPTGVQPSAFTGGDVVFEDSPTDVLAGPVPFSAPGTVTANLPPSSAGFHPITAIATPYDKVDFAPGSSSATNPVQKANVQASATIPVIVSKVGEDVPLLITLTGIPSGVAGPSGTITLTDSARPGHTKSFNYTSNPTPITVPADFLAQGTNILTAVYSGDVNFNQTPPSNPVKLLVQVQTTLTLEPFVNDPLAIPPGTLPPNTTLPGVQVTMTADVSANSPGTGHPDGAVAFAYFDPTLKTIVTDYGELQPDPNNANQSIAKVTTSSLPRGVTTIVATYLGSTDGTYLPSPLPGSPPKTTAESSQLFVFNGRDYLPGSTPIPGTLRYALSYTDPNPDDDHITFVLPVNASTLLITPQAPFVITNPVDLDASALAGVAAPAQGSGSPLTSPPDLNPHPVQIDGSDMVGYEDGTHEILDVASSGVVIDGLDLHGIDGPAIRVGTPGVPAPSGVAIVDNFLGTDWKGLSQPGQSEDAGVEADAGSGVVVAGNLIAGLGFDNNSSAPPGQVAQGAVGVRLESGTSGSMVANNIIGSTADLRSILGTASVGVLIDSSAGNTIAGNMIVGDQAAHLLISGQGATNNLIAANLIGIGADGSPMPFPDQRDLDGVDITGGSGNTLAGNTIGGYDRYGVFLNGTGAAGNTLTGDTIGGTSGPGQGLVLQNSPANAIQANTIQSNAIGAVLTGKGTTGNRIHGNTFANNSVQSATFSFGAPASQIAWKDDNKIVKD